MRSSHTLDRVDTAFDDDRLVPDAGLILPATLAHHLGLKQLVDDHLDLGAKVGRANVGDKVLTLVMSALAGGDHIDHANALRAGTRDGSWASGSRRPPPWPPSRAASAGATCASSTGSVESCRRAWMAGAGPGADALTIDLDSTICETYGLRKQGARHHGYTGVRGYHPLLAVAAGTGDVLMARLREGRANSGRSAGHFLRARVGRVRHAGPRASSRCAPTRAPTATPWSRCAAG
jgi:hypothetical protein